ncbi:flagellar biosynthetic protein FliR [Pleionea sp. CnH1-48]|uniref:flagellar biosynthetic protein FliR n=1 Tax=Pleionea sp. CnH1-48 TaxID=2954494 RepID=UPI0020972CA5|nr:flagellar biosynthetic protein FliR [Pleionea sp. CnH1-48]MCO7223724.1 flagellar biosynthetic protein FliR [Pleionea sp. CnH1-48]
MTPWTNDVLVVLLIMLRIIPIFMSSAMTPLSRLPTTSKVMMLIIFSIMTSVIVPTKADMVIETMFEFVYLASYELLLGIAFAFGLQAAIASLQTMGRVIDMQIGFGAAGIIDPKTSNSESLIGTLLMMVSLVLFFELNLHHDLLMILLWSFNKVPVGSLSSSIDFWLLLSTLSQQFFLALVLALPVILTLLVLDALIGFVAKTMPQMNIYFVGLPLKIAVGLIAFTISARLMYPAFESIFEEVKSFWHQWGGA